jgi:hypothetical protein
MRHDRPVTWNAISRTRSFWGFYGIQRALDSKPFGAGLVCQRSVVDSEGFETGGAEPEYFAECNRFFHGFRENFIVCVVRHAILPACPGMNVFGYASRKPGCKLSKSRHHLSDFEPPMSIFKKVESNLWILIR